MNFFNKHKLSILTAFYWFLLAYIVAALLWWFIALNKQNSAMINLQVSQLQKNTPQYAQQYQKIMNDKKRKTTQYVGEGFFFLILILIGAVFVYRATKRQLHLSQQQHNFMMAVTHELKTPIAVAQLNLETLQKRKLDEETQQKLIHNTLNETNRLNGLCNNILLAAQLDGGAYHSSKQKIFFSELVTKQIEMFKNSFPKRKFNTDIDDEVYLLGEELLLQMLLNNLTENAIKYSPAEKPITIQLKIKADKAVLKVADEGIGISDVEKKKIFQKFYRVGNENTRKAKGSGLGLYLCKQIILKHRGEITVTDNIPVGTIFTATFNMS